MKNILLALETLSAMAGSAFDADVTLYGLVDYGFSYQHVDQEVDGHIPDEVRPEFGQPLRLEGR